MLTFTKWGDMPETKVRIFVNLICPQASIQLHDWLLCFSVWLSVWFFDSRLKTMLVVHNVTMDFLCSLCAVFCPCNIRGLRPNLPVSFLPSGVWVITLKWTFYDLLNNSTWFYNIRLQIDICAPRCMMQPRKQFQYLLDFFVLTN